MAAFFCKLVPPRAGFAATLSAAEADVMRRHALYWQDLIGRGVLRVFALGPVMDPAGDFGIAVVEADGEAAVRACAAEDPAVTSGIGMHYDIHPMPRGVMHS